MTIVFFFDRPLLTRREKERSVANSNGWTKGEKEREKERKGAKVEWKTREEGENGQWRIQVLVARRGWNSWLDRSRLRDGDKLFISRRLATGQHFPYLSTILRLFIRAWAHVVVRPLPRFFIAFLSLFLFMSLHSDRYTVATIHPEFMVLLERKFTSIHDLVGESRANQRKGRKINNRASRD